MLFRMSFCRHQVAELDSYLVGDGQCIRLICILLAVLAYHLEDSTPKSDFLDQRSSHSKDQRKQTARLAIAISSTSISDSKRLDQCHHCWKQP